MPAERQAGRVGYRRLWSLAAAKPIENAKGTPGERVVTLAYNRRDTQTMDRGWLAGRSLNIESSVSSAQAEWVWCMPPKTNGWAALSR